MTPDDTGETTHNAAQSGRMDMTKHGALANKHTKTAHEHSHN